MECEGGIPRGMKEEAGKDSGADALMGNTRTHAEHDG